jgi:hypothetical protein
MADPQNDDAALIRLALAISNKPPAAPKSQVRVSDPFSGETRTVPLHEQDLTRPRFQQLEDLPRHRSKPPGEDALLSAPSGADQLRDASFRLRSLPGMEPIARAMAGPLPDKGDPRAQVRQLPGLPLAASETSQLDPVAVLGMPELSMTPAARLARSRELGFTDTPWYHGTTHDLQHVDLSRANPDSYYGEGFYATSNPADAGTNYATQWGPDLQRRISERAAEIENELAETQYQGRMPPWNSDERKILISQARQRARQELIGTNQGVILPLRLKMRQPMVTAKGPDETIFDFTPEMDAEGEVVNENPLLERFVSAVHHVADQYQFDPNKVLQSNHLVDYLFDQVHASDLDRALWQAMGEAYPIHPQSGGVAFGQAIRDIYRELGYDGIIMDAHKQFNWMQDVTPGTRHAIVFEPHQVRSVNAAFDPAKAGSGNILHADPFGAGSSLRFMASHPQAAATTGGAALGGAIGSDADPDHPVRGALAGAALGAAAGHAVGGRSGARLLEDRGRIGSQRWHPDTLDAFKFTDLPRTARPSSVYKAIIEHGGYTVNPHTGDLVVPGQPGPVMAGKYPNGNPRTLVVPRAQFTPDAVGKWFKANFDVFAKHEDAHIGGWVSGDQVYLDVSTGYANVRKATKAAEQQAHPLAARDGEGRFVPRGQEAVWDPVTGEHPVGNVHEFINSPEFRSRMEQMLPIGREAMGGKNWWNIKGGPIEATYGSEHLPIVAGMIASASPQQNVENNMRIASEYVRRVLVGEPVVQPNFKVPKGSVGFTPGEGIAFTKTHANNTEKVADWRMEQLRADKVNDMFHALMGDPNAAVFDRHWAKLIEDAERGIYADREENVVRGPLSSSNKRSPYADIENVVRDAAKAAGVTPADYSAWVWEGIRKTIKETGELFGTKYKAEAIPGRPEGFNEVFERLVQEKADLRNISVEAFKARLRKGDATLLSAVLATATGLRALTAWRAQATDQAPPASGQR